MQTLLITFIDYASRVCCHGHLFVAENVDTLIESLRAAFYKRAVPHSLYVDNGSSYTSKEIVQICARVGSLVGRRRSCFPGGFRQNDLSCVMNDATQSEPGSHARFQDTHWSVVLAVHRSDAAHAQRALETLCRTYWYPLYAHARRRGNDHHLAQDVTQAFFARLLEKQWLHGVAPEKGRFRSFLLTALDHFLANEWRHARTARRGGGKPVISLEDTHAGEERFANESAAEVAPERAFDKTWALTVMNAALAQLEQEFIKRGRAVQFEDWKLFLTREATADDCDASARRLGMSAGAVTVAIHRMRARYGDFLYESVAHTVPDAADANDELRYLFSLLNE